MPHRHRGRCLTVLDWMLPLVDATELRGWPSGWASAFQADLHGFESRTPLHPFLRLTATIKTATPEYSIKPSVHSKQRVQLVHCFRLPIKRDAGVNVLVYVQRVTELIRHHLRIDALIAH